MNQENFSQQNESTEGPKASIVTLVVVVVLAIIGIGIFLWQKSVPTTNDQALEVFSSPTPTIGGQLYSGTNFSYVCPTDWTLGENKNYNGEVNLSECSMIYSGQYSFDDGVDLTFGYVPQTVADNIDATGQKYSDTILSQVKNEDNAKPYTNGDFTGWISMANNAHTLALVARYPVDGGYYEVTATAMGDTKTDQEYKEMIDDIISTFQIK